MEAVLAHRIRQFLLRGRGGKPRGLDGQESPPEALVPVIALQGPVEHHRATRQAAVAEGAGDPEGITGAAEGRWQRGRRVALQRGVGCGRRGLARSQLADHHPGGGLHRLGSKERLRQISGGRCTGLPPELPSFPSEAEGG